MERGPIPTGPIFAGPIFVGTAGWSLPVPLQGDFPGEGTHLQRYAGQLEAVEINSSFYRPHRRKTYASWAASVPEGFRFSVKVPREITHQRRLGAKGLGEKGPGQAGAAGTGPEEVEALLRQFLEEAGGLGEKLGVILVQLPPSLKLEAKVAGDFFALLGGLTTARVVVEPRHPTWFGEAAEALLLEHRVGRVAADPAPVPAAATPGACRDIVYYRLHGSPVMYYSNYPEGYLERLLATLRAEAEAGREAWCIFDNTAEFAALANALTMGGKPSSWRPGLFNVGKPPASGK